MRVTRPDEASQRLLQTIELQRRGCEMAGSPLYASILEQVADDVRRGGPVAGLLTPYADRAVGDAVLLRLLGGVHRLVLAGKVPELAAHYPSVGGRAGRRLGAAFTEVVEDHHRVLAADLQSGVQTNEVGRSAALLVGYLRLAAGGLPLRVLEVGASAGLNLAFDRYHYTQGAWKWGPADSPLAFCDPFMGPPPAIPPSVNPLRVIERRGCDPHPIDPTTEEGRLRLRSFVWPDQPHRRARLDAALEVATAHPVAIDQADAGGWLSGQLARPRAGVMTVVSHSIVLQYLDHHDRRDLVTLIEEAGGRAGPSAPLAWLRMEPAGERAEVRLTTWPGAISRRLATSAYHGPPVAVDAT